MLEHFAQKRGAQPLDGSAPNHLQVGDREGLVHKQENISRVSTSASDTADANNGPLIPKYRSFSQEHCHQHDSH